MFSRTLKESTPNSKILFGIYYGIGDHMKSERILLQKINFIIALAGTNAIVTQPLNKLIRYVRNLEISVIMTYLELYIGSNIDKVILNTMIGSRVIRLRDRTIDSVINETTIRKLGHDVKSDTKPLFIGNKSNFINIDAKIKHEKYKIDRLRNILRYDNPPWPVEELIHRHIDIGTKLIQTYSKTDENCDNDFI